MSPAPLQGKTVFMSGGSRGIGLAIALRAARDGANVALLAKTAEPHPKLEGTIHTAAKAIEDAGGRALPFVGDVRDDESVAAFVAQAAERFGGIDIVVNNASAITLAPTRDLPVKRYDLMQDINARGTFVVTRACLPHLSRSDHAHVLTLSPPLALDRRWLAGHSAYTLSKLGMTILTLGLAADEAAAGIAANCLWPRTIIATAAVRNIVGGEAGMARARSAEIMADAAYEILRQDPRTCTGRTFIDDEALAEAGVTDLDRYAAPGADLALDLFVDGWPGESAAGAPPQVPAEQG
jgi:citronellol/citronellal dehydrogenase